MQRTVLEDCAQPLVSAILSGAIPADFASLLGLPAVDGVPPLERWLANALVEPDAQADLRLIWSLKLPLYVNDCSMQSKPRQVRGRRKSLAPLSPQSSNEWVALEII